MMTFLYWVRTIPARWRSSLLASVLLVVPLALEGRSNHQIATSGDRSLEPFSMGVLAWQQKDYSAAIKHLQTAQSRVPQLGDYINYYLGSARLELKDFALAARDAEAVRNFGVPSPLAGRSIVLEARARLELQPGSTGASQAIRLLREHYADLPQPEGALALAAAYEAARDLADAVQLYQKVYYRHPAGEPAVQAAAALVTLRDTMSASYPPPMPEQMLERVNKLLGLRQYSQARAEFDTLISQLGGVERDLARVGIGVTDFLRGQVSTARDYLQSLRLPDSEADAERCYYLVECVRKLNNDDEMLAAIERLDRLYPNSQWRLKALVAAGNRFLIANRPDKYEPLFRAVCDSFSSEREAAGSHWKLAWSAYIQRRHDAEGLLRAHLTRYPDHSKASAALYFLGRLAEAHKDYAGARAFYTKIDELYPNYFYGLLARQRLSEPKVVGAGPSPKTAGFLKEIDFADRPNKDDFELDAPTRVRIERARLLSMAGFSDWADNELRFGAKTDGRPFLLAMELARMAESPHQALHNMKSVAPEYLSLKFERAPRRFWELLFPLPYKQELVGSAKHAALDPYILAALIRQESEFNPNAVSRANAYGLTQVVPATGRQLARRSGLRRFTPAMLFEPGTNLRLGASYLRAILDQWGGKWEQTLASYNAGKSRVDEWLTWASFSEPAEFLETIPFTETREYVESVLRNAALYSRIYRDTSLEVGPAENRLIRRVAHVSKRRPHTLRHATRRRHRHTIT